MQTSRHRLVWNIFITAFWIRAVWGFVAQEFFYPLQDAEMAIQFGFDLAMIGLGVYTLRARKDIVYMAVFIAVAAVSTLLLNGLSVSFFLNGLRDFIGLLFLMPIFRYFVEDEERRQFLEERFDRHLYVFLIIQAVCIPWQFFKYGAGDHGGGSLGNGYSGIISTLIYLISFYLMRKRVDPAHYLHGLWSNRHLVLLLTPSLMNETKVSFVLLFMYFLLLLPMDRRMFFRLLLTIPVLFMVLVGSIMAYVKLTGNDAADAFTLEYYTEMYLYSDESEEYAKWLYDNDLWESEDIPRFTKLLILTEVNDEHPGHAWLGFGIGHFKGHSGGGIINPSDLYIEYEWLILGTIPYLMHIWMQLGFVGIGLVLLFFVINLRSTKGHHVDFNIASYILLLVLIVFFYNDSLRNGFMMSVICYIMLFGRGREASIQELIR